MILITGVAGLIGSNFAHWVIKNKPECSIIGIDNLSGGYIENVPSNISYHNIDLMDGEAVEKIFEHNKIDVIYHFAAYAAECLSPFIRVYNYNNNLITSANLINMAIKYKIKRFVFTSSMATYGNGSVPFDETDRLQPIDPYGIAKYSVEQDLNVAYVQHGLEYCIIVPHNVFGERQNIWDRYRNVIGIWMRNIIEGHDILIYGTGQQERAFTYISNILQPLWLAGVSERSKNQRINLGGIESITLNDLAELVSEIAKKDGYTTAKRYVEARHEVFKAWCTYEKSVSLLNYKEQVSIMDGIQKMWDWAKIQKPRTVKSWDKYELDEKIYSYWK